MKTVIPNASYVRADVFDAEQRMLFRRVWQCVGFVSDLTSHNDFITREVGGLSVVVQNFNGELRAFENVCSHRFNRIQTQCKGNRILQCGYHGWTFDQSGLPTGIPKRPRFDALTPMKIQELRLHSWRVECCGSLVFVCFDPDTPSLQTYLGECFDRIAQMTEACGTVIDENVILIQANWKILIENTLEAYHVGFVHPQTFGRLGVAEGQFAWQPPHSSWHTSVSSSVAQRFDRLESLTASRPFKIDGYFHQLIFPNLTIATTQGTSFSVQFFEPLSPILTRFTSVVFQTRLENTDALHATMIEVMNQSIRNFNRAVFSEDKVVCEQVQLGTAQTTHAGILSDDEMRVHEFQKHYDRQMGEPLES
jgi:phenylpropionate dioxygenase-like ring-hydroxylating dioxygenase large terminal subunit